MSSQHSVIVGGSSGIGLATAKRLIMLGHRVTILGRNTERLKAALAELDGQAAQLVMDAAEPVSVTNAFAHIGSFEHLVLALGSRKGVGPFASINLADVRGSFEEKVFPHFATAQAALPYLAKNGSMTFVAAVSAHASLPGTSGIGAANAAVVALVPILAAELRPLRVNGVSPGVIDTPWWNFLTAEQRSAAFADFAAKTPAGRVGTPDDIAQVIGSLVSNSFMSGQVVVCDGGLSRVA